MDNDLIINGKQVVIYHNKSMIVTALKYIIYKLFARHRKGHGIHSPFVFDFIKNILCDKSENNDFDLINNIHLKLLSSTKWINVSDYGSGSKILKGKTRRVSDILKTSSTPKKYGKVLYRIVKIYHPNSIIELGASLGISTLYLSMADKNIPVYTVEGCPQISSLAKETFAQARANNVNMINDQFDNALPKLLPGAKLPLVAYIDGNHRFQPILHYFHQCLEYIDEESIIIIADIHWSNEMEKAWKKICSHYKVKATIDLFHLGIVFFRKELSKQNFVINY